MRKMSEFDGEKGCDDSFNSLIKLWIGILKIDTVAFFFAGYSLMSVFYSIPKLGLIKQNEKKNFFGRFSFPVIVVVDVNEIDTMLLNTVQ